ncbi:MAG: aminopeptidase P family protein [Alphaproteobacteria bacterium]|nr:aminopeptidase P family protein [Alphaproteobacteria bacterium]
MSEGLYQSFEETSERSATPARIAELRRLLAAEGLAGFLVPRTDEFQNEYVPANAERLAWLTGFTGSAGTAVVLKDRAALFVDGRYVTQAPLQVDTGLFEIHQVPEASLASWLEGALKAGERIGYDPWLHSRESARAIAAAAKAAGGGAVAVPRNLVDRIWTDRPSPPGAPAAVHPQALAGRTSAMKRVEIAAAIAKAGADAAVLSLPESIVWLLNIRGSDVPHTPLVLSYAIVGRDERVSLFVDPAKVTAEVAEHLGAGVAVRPLGDFAAALADLGRASARVLVSSATAPGAILDALENSGARLVDGPDPCILPKARKNAVELAGIRAAHERDGLALTRFLAWLAREAPKGTLDEVTAAIRLETFRRETNALKDLSFDTISGSGPHGAIVHYRVTGATNRVMKPGELFLVDSGGQYADGTTDVTRTVAIGEPAPEMRDRFTRVLKGHIALARARFPKGTTGAHLDVLARQFLWEAGLDYDHGTGHGVGAYLSVHEGPQSISRRPSPPLEEGMIVSNEPGFYRVGAYGIRIENLVVVTPAEVPPGGERAMHGFETLTLAPIDRALIDRAMLTDAERAWIDAYHARILAVHGPRLDAQAGAWLAAATAPL